MYSALAPSRLTVHPSWYLLIVFSTPSAHWFPSLIMRSKLSLVNTLLSVAFIAARDRALAAKVPPTPPVSITSSSTSLLIAAATLAFIPNAPVGNPPPIAFPIVKKSGSRPSSAVIPPGPTEIVCVSSTINIAPNSLANFSTPFK